MLQQKNSRFSFKKHAESARKPYFLQRRRMSGSSGGAIDTGMKNKKQKNETTDKRKSEFNKRFKKRIYKTGKAKKAKKTKKGKGDLKHGMARKARETAKKAKK